MIVVTNRIPVSKGHESDFEDRFKHRVHLVDQSPGFIRNALATCWLAADSSSMVAPGRSAWSV